jgi:cell division protein FtsB
MKRPPFSEVLLPYLKNKYVIASVAFLVWISFFDRNDFITTHSYQSKLEALQKEKRYYEEEIGKNKTELNDLMTNRDNLEKYGRENYFMKKDNEEIFVIINTKPVVAAKE